MWCTKCEADVAAEVTPDNASVRCASCGNEIAATLRSSPIALEARRLLERWSQGNMADPFGPIPTVDAADVRSPASPVKTNRPRTSQKLPADSGFEFADVNASSRQKAPRAPVQDNDQSPPLPADVSATLYSTEAAQPVSDASLWPDMSHKPAVWHPQFDVRSAIEYNQRRKGAWASVLGQLLAYGGVGVMTIGTSLVLWGHFGGPPAYVPTGWLISTMGQMLLLLGVVTLISGAMEHTADEVARRVEGLSDRILQIEQQRINQQAPRAHNKVG